MNSLKLSTIDFTYKKPKNLKVINFSNIPLPKDFSVKEKSIVLFEPKGKGGNHSHPRTEIFVCVQGELKLLWQDEKNIIHQENMSSQAKSLKIFTIPPYLPHAVVNPSETSQATLLEFADAFQSNVSTCNLI